MRRGRVLSVNPVSSGEPGEIMAEYPMTGLFPDAVCIKIYDPGGRGAYSYEFARYEQSF